MYIPKKFRIEDAEEIKDFLNKNSFGALISLVETRITATHLPWHLVEDATTGEWLMHAHIAKPNPQWQALETSPEVMLMFQGAHAYVSSQWYSEENAPTWNYQSVHVYGQARIVSQPELEAMLVQLLQQHEAFMPNPLSYQDLSSDLRERFLKGIVGIEVRVTDLQAAYKLSQNRTAFDFQNIVKELENIPDAQSHEVAKQMKKLNK